MRRLGRHLALACLALATACGGGDEPPERPTDADSPPLPAHEVHARAREALARAQETIRSNQALLDALQAERRSSTPPAPGEGADPEETSRALERELARLREQLRAQEREIARLEEQARARELTVEGPPGPDATSVRPPAGFHVEGEVVEVDRATGTVFLSVGSEAGVRQGYRLTISRDARYVAVVEVVGVEAGRARARVLPDLEKEGPRVGDRVSY